MFDLHWVQLGLELTRVWGGDVKPALKVQRIEFDSWSWCTSCPEIKSITDGFNEGGVDVTPKISQYRLFFPLREAHDNWKQGIFLDGPFNGSVLPLTDSRQQRGAWGGRRPDILQSWRHENTNSTLMCHQHSYTQTFRTCFYISTYRALQASSFTFKTFLFES